MPTYVPPKKNTEYIFYIGLRSQADSTILQVNPTIADGDFKVSVDGGAVANPATTPTVTPAGGKAVKVTLSASEMNGDNIAFYASDAAGAQWMDTPLMNFQTTAVQIDNKSFGIVDSGTASALPDSTHLTLATLGFETNALAGRSLYIVSATTGAGQTITVNSNTNATPSVLAFDAPTISLTGTVVYVLFATPTASSTLLPDVNAAKLGGQTVTASGGITFPAATIASTTNITAGTVTTVSGNVSGNVVGSVGSVTGAVGSVTATVTADVDKINGTTVLGTGAVGDLWRG